MKRKSFFKSYRQVRLVKDSNELKKFYQDNDRIVRITPDEAKFMNDQQENRLYVYELVDDVKEEIEAEEKEVKKTVNKKK